MACENSRVRTSSPPYAFNPVHKKQLTGAGTKACPTVVRYGRTTQCLLLQCSGGGYGTSSDIISEKWVAPEAGASKTTNISLWRPCPPPFRVCSSALHPALQSPLVRPWIQYLRMWCKLHPERAPAHGFLSASCRTLGQTFPAEPPPVVKPETSCA